MNLYPKNILPVKEVRKFIVIFYLIAVLGFVVPFTQELFIQITPLALIVNIYLLAIYHPSFSRKHSLAFALIFLLGFGVEVFGVKTGFVFGRYTYDQALGIKLFDTPLLIGLNWLFLTYAATATAERLKIKGLPTLLSAPLLMVVYDWMVEQVAPKMNMWHWQHAQVPIRNYIAWYVIAMSFVLLLKAFRVETKNPLATIIFISQFVFFSLLTILW